MARNGSGTYARIAGTPYVYNTVIDQVVVNAEMDDIATALTNSIAKDGQTTPTANLPMGTYILTGLGAGSSAGHSIRYEQVQDVMNQGAAKGSDIASASTITCANMYSYFVVTGTTGITAIANASKTGRIVVLEFSGALTLTHSAGLILPGAADITTVAGDVLAFVYESTGVWRCVNYQSKPGKVTGLQVLKTSADIASAATIDLTAADGNTTRITGTNATSAFTMTAGQWHMCIADGAWPLTYHATTNKLNTGGVDYTCEAGDRVLLHKDDDNIIQATILPTSGAAVVSSNSVLVQVVDGTPYVTYSSTSTTIPNDDSVPQKTEGVEYATVAITPSSATNILIIEATATSITADAARTLTGAIFQDDAAGALAAGQVTPGGAAYAAQLYVRHEMVAGTTSATTFKFRIGPSGGTMYVNGGSSARTLGGLNAVKIKVSEVLV